MPESEARSETPASFVLGGSRHLRPERATVLSIAVIAAVVLVPLRGLYKGVGSSMEEGFMLVFPKRMLAGDVPNVDFLHLYGPGSLHTLMGWYSVFGYTLEAQRTFGLLQHVALIGAVYALTRAWGYRLAVVSAVTVTLLVLTPIGLSALAWEGAVALGLWAVVFGVRSLNVEGRSRQKALVATGLLAGFALSYRPDLVIALTLGLVLVLLAARAWKLPLIGAVIGLIPMWIHLAMAGIGPSWTGMVTDPVFELRPGRALPRPPGWSQIDGALQAVAEGPNDAPWWGFPSPSASQQLFLWFFLVLAVALGVAATAGLLYYRVGRTPQRFALLAAGLFGLGMLPQAMQRPDSTHLAWGSCISFALVPTLIVEVVQWRWPGVKWFRRDLIAAGIVAVVLFVICPFFTYRYYLLYSRISIGSVDGGHLVQRDGRNFYFGNVALQNASQAVINRLDAESEPGQRLLVGPADLSRTIYSDVAFYFMFPELDPATFFIEMDPGLADAEGSRLADDVASADWLILTNFWTGWFEPNASIEFGSDAPNQVVADQFCLVESYDNALVLLYRKCEVGDGISPAGIGIGAERRADLDREIAERGLDSP